MLVLECTSVRRHMCVNSVQCWVAYKETVVESLDKALGLFASKKVESTLHLDLNRNPSPLVASTPSPINQDQMSEPHFMQQDWPTLSPTQNNQNEGFEEENDEHEEDDNEVDLHDNNVGDLDQYHVQETMDQSIPFPVHMHRTRMTMVPMKKLMRRGSRRRRPKHSRRYSGGITRHHCSRILVSRMKPL